MNPEAPKLKELGNEAFKKKDFTTALKNYEKAIELDPKEMAYYSNIAAVYFQMNHFDKCINFSRQACKIGQENGAKSKLIFKGFERMGRAHKEMDDLKMAKLVFEKSKSFLEKALKEKDTSESEYEKCLSEIELAIDRCQIKVSQNLQKVVLIYAIFEMKLKLLQFYAYLRIVTNIFLFLEPIRSH